MQWLLGKITGSQSACCLHWVLFRYDWATVCISLYPGLIPGMTGKWVAASPSHHNPACPKDLPLHILLSLQQGAMGSETQHLFFGTTQLPNRIYGCFTAPFFFCCHLCVAWWLPACATGQVNLIYVRCIHWEVRTRSLKMTNIASDRVPTSLNCLPFRSTFMRERRKTEGGTLHTVSHILIRHRLLVLQKASVEFLYKKLIRKIRCSETC